MAAKRPAASKAAKKPKTKKEESESVSIASESVENSSVGVASEDQTELQELVDEVVVSSSVGSDANDNNEEMAIDEAGSGSVSEETQSGSGAEEVDDETMRTIFIKGLDYDTREGDIRDEMEKIGSVVRVNLPMTHDSRRNKGFAYVEFKRLVDAKKGLKLNDTMLLGRKVVVDQARPKSNYKLYTVFAKNLSFDTKKEELVEHFGKYGKVFNLSLPIDAENEGRNKGYCFIEYTDEEAANKIVEQKHVINDRRLYLSLGNKNEERNQRRSSDRLYGRGNEDRDYNNNNRGPRPYGGDREGRSYGRDGDRGSRPYGDRGGRSYDRNGGDRSYDRRDGGRRDDRRDDRREDRDSYRSNKITFSDNE